MRRLLLAALLAAACAKDAASLAPFPCAADQTCPGGVACLPGVGCVKPKEDVLCASDGECAGVGAGAACSLGRCGLPCNNGQGCASGRICSTQVGAGVCLPDCTTGQACPDQLACADLWNAGKKACLAAGNGFETACSNQGSACGPRGAPALCDEGLCKASCTDGAGCGAGRVCSTNTGAGVCLPDCSGGQACPTGSACGRLWYGTSTKACMSSSEGLDAACTTPGHCGPLGAASVCDGLVCGVSCNAGAGCPSDRVCSSSTGAGVCLADCTASGTCPAGLACNGPWPDSKKYCVPAGEGLNTVCASTAKNGDACGPLGTAAACDTGLCTLPCHDGAGCPAGSVCTASSGAGACVSGCTVTCAPLGGGCSAPSCPGGLACADVFGLGAGCLPPGQGTDIACTGVGSACGPTGANATCIAPGICEVSCQGGGSCPSGRICSTPVGGGAGGCLVDCTSSTACPGTAPGCYTLHGGGKYGCAPSPVPACASVTTGALCPNGCGAGWSVSCTGGGTCVTGSACIPGNPPQCQCQHEYAYDCNGTNCGDVDGGCKYPGWNCRPVAPTKNLGCNDPGLNAAASCNCADGRVVAMSCGDPSSCELLCSSACEVAPQSGCSGARAKCAAIKMGGIYVPTCVAQTGSGALGAPCTRASADDLGIGFDDCGPGLFCSDVGGSFTCHQHCSSASGCGAGSACLILAAKGANYSNEGICVTAAAQCAPGSNGCPGGYTCAPYLLSTASWTEQCRKAGPVAAGDPCTDESDCGANLTCSPNQNSGGAPVCTPVCSSSFACPAGGLECQALTGLTGGYGTCF